MDLMNSLDTDGNGKGEEQSRRGDLETEKRGGGGGRVKFIRVYVGGPRCKIHRCTVVPSNLIPVFRLIQPVASRTPRRGEGRKLTKMYEDANLTTSLSCIYVPVVCILTS